MRFFQALITNHPLANIAFVVVILMGLLAYTHMPREQDPEINFNWVNISTALPGASAEDVEK
ncbi:MAG: efflux RND transporter permease subunit, partial [Candidatus Competibacteraceae bacterium]|nr:efflux RND transporter permease subunit [Candidatus Competibacteraceae bacterium]